MPRKITDTAGATFQKLEQDAYHAFIEWGLFLVRKIKQLEQHIEAAEENLQDKRERNEK